MPLDLIGQLNRLTRRFPGRCRLRGAEWFSVAPDSELIR